MPFAVPRLLLAGSLALFAVACTPTIDQRGNRPLAERLAEVKVNQTKTDVLALLGTPATTPPFSDDHWYYISSTIETFAFFAPDEISREVVAIDFNKAGRVTGIRKLSLANGKDVSMVSRETPAPGKELSLFEQFIGNVGRFNDNQPGAGGGGGGGGGPGGGP